MRDVFVGLRVYVCIFCQKIHYLSLLIIRMFVRFILIDPISIRVLIFMRNDCTVGRAVLMFHLARFLIKLC